MAINRLFLVLGLLASAGSLVHARLYRSGVGENTAEAYASTEVYAGEEYIEDSYNYNQNTKRTNPGSLSDWAGSGYPRSMDRTNPSSLDWAGYDNTQSMDRTNPSSLDWTGSDYPRSTDRTNPGSLDWAGYDNTQSMDRTNPGSLDWAGYDNTRSMEWGNPGSLDWDVEERSEFNGRKQDDSWLEGDDQAPSQAPTKAPSESPAQVPTENPSQTPAQAPAENPSEAPAQAPAENPGSQAPAQAPAENPGQAPPSPNVNPIDDCWRHDPNWSNNRQALANCAVGFGKNAMGGADGPIYVVTDNSDDELVNPKEGTLRYGVLQDGPLWITFAKNMSITLKNELIMSSHKTIDGRGFQIHITGAAGLTLQYTSNIIIHSLFIHDLKPTGPAVIRSNSSHSGHRRGSDGDAISIFGSHDIWVDHCYFARGPDGLVDVIMGSTAISITNNFFEEHDKVMLFGAHPYDQMDNNMQVSVAYNHFGPGLIERTPRVRHGLAHIFNNYYTTWGQYAIGGSEAPTILSEGNVFNAPDSRDKQVTKRIDDGDESFKDAKKWNWHSKGDKFLNGAYFVASGAGPDSMVFSKAASTNRIVPADIVPDITSGAGPLVL